LAALSIQAQDYIGFHSSNYAGVSKARYQPASIADSRFIVDVNLFGLDLNFGNNYLGVKREAMSYEQDLIDSAGNFRDAFLSRDPNDDSKHLHFYLNSQLPSFICQ
jgi:hypothetical protein